jgi:hypothetical protein
MARFTRVCGLLAASLVVLACGGGTLNRSSVRSDAAERWNCPKKEITETQESPTVVRVTGCGQSAVYVCTMVHKSRPIRHDPMRTEQEAARIDAGASCRPALQQASDAR